MIPPKRSGRCSLCDELCFEVMAIWDEGEKRAGQPKRFGPPMNDSVRVSFLLFDGSRTDMTFCGNCAATLNPEHYTTLWRRNLAGYMVEQNGNPEKFKDQFSNGLLCEMGRKTWTEIANGRS